jgi:GNAT superfamily N-acetyltransferase
MTGECKESERLTVSLNGYTDLPAGKLASIVTYLEMRAPPEMASVPGPWALEPLAGDLRRYRDLYARVGEPWLWFSRRAMSDADLASILRDPDVEALALRLEDDIGLLELDWRKAGSCEVAFLGLAPEAIGSGAGRFLIREAIRRAFARPIERLFLHTCTRDHPKALPFYMRAGFAPCKQAIEIVEDPRLTGVLPRDAAPDAPFFER